MNKNYKSLFLLVLFICEFLISDAKSILVGKGHSITSIKFALKLIKPFDTIRVSRGIYFEKNLVISFPLILIGENYPILDGEKKYEVVSIKSDHVTITGFIIKNSGISSMIDYAAIKVYNSSFVNITNNLILDSFFGIYMQYASHCIISKNKLVAHHMQEQKSANGIHCWNSSDLKILGNEITGHRDGIYFEFVKNSKIVENSSYGNLRYGLHFMFSNNDEYVSNSFSNNGAGVAVMFSNHVNMHNNRFKDNWGDASYGLLLKEISDSKIEKNIFERNTAAVFMEGTSRIKMVYNTFKKNGWALKIQASCLDIDVNKNNFIGNTFDVSTNGTLVLNNFNFNYWDKYEGYDLNHDKIGDIPYRPISLFSVIIEQNPTTLFMFRSIITVLMDKAEKVIPSLTPERLKDDTPSLKPISL